MWKYDIYKDTAGKWRWRLIDTGNRKKVATSGESFASRANALRAARTVKAKAGSAALPEEDFDKLLRQVARRRRRAA